MLTLQKMFLVRTRRNKWYVVSVQTSTLLVELNDMQPLWIYYKQTKSHVNWRWTSPQTSTQKKNGASPQILKHELHPEELSKVEWNHECWGKKFDNHFVIMKDKSWYATYTKFCVSWIWMVLKKKTVLSWSEQFLASKKMKKQLDTNFVILVEVRELRGTAISFPLKVKNSTVQNFVSHRLRWPKQKKLLCFLLPQKR